MHFTYSEPDLTCLKQGDILRRTPELLELFDEVHPHYARDEYCYFQVLTQSCDLVLRNSGCKTRYISLAVVRKVEDVVERSIEGFGDKFEAYGKVFCSSKYKRNLIDFFDKLYNNNDTSHFFLKSQPDYGLMFDCCTKLHLSISVRAYEHYQKCLDAKCLELDENFRAKLGWLVGNLYSRIGTEDYCPTVISSRDDYEGLLLEKATESVGWVRQEDFSLFSKKHASFDSFDALLASIDEEKRKQRERKLDQIVRPLAKALKLNKEQEEVARNVLGANSLIASQISK